MQSSTTICNEIDSKRTVEVLVDWTTSNDQIEIANVTPQRVFVRQDNGTEKVIGVHTATGRNHLLSRVSQASIKSQLLNQVEMPV